MQADERWLLGKAQEQMREQRRVDLHDVLARYRVRKGRAVYLCQKWVLKGWYDYENDLLAGWLTEDGMAECD